MDAGEGVGDAVPDRAAVPFEVGVGVGLGFD
jgi:hypothetical protein